VSGLAILAESMQHTAASTSTWPLFEPVATVVSGIFALFLAAESQWVAWCQGRTCSLPLAGNHLATRLV